MRKKFLKSVRPTYSIKRVKKAQFGTSLTSYKILSPLEQALPQFYTSIAPSLTPTSSLIRPRPLETVQDIEESEVEEPTNRYAKFRGKQIDLYNSARVLTENLARNPRKHYCTRAVSNGLDGITNVAHASGFATPRELHAQLVRDGWVNVLDDNYTPQIGDVYTTWNQPGGGMHSSMWNGQNWISYGIEDNGGGSWHAGKPWLFNNRGRGNTQMYVMRANSNDVIKAQFGTKLTSFDSQEPLNPLYNVPSYTDTASSVEDIDYSNIDVDIDDDLSISEDMQDISEDKVDLTDNQLDIYHKFGTTGNKYDEFAATMAPIFRQALLDNGYSTDALPYLLKQAALESGYGLNGIGQGGFNLGGIRLGQSYRNFSSLYDYANYAVQLLNNRYNALEASSERDFIDRLHGHNPSKSYYSESYDRYLSTMPSMNTFNSYLNQYV